MYEFDSRFANQLAVVIPAYRPSSVFVDLVRTLSERAIGPIIVVDDGSGPEYQQLFLAAAQFPSVELLRHGVNLGKGAALKTAFNHVLCTMPGLLGVVTADADGQHDPADIEQVAAKLRANPEALVMGSRTFDREVPLRSRIGNITTRGVVRVLLGEKLEDTQTGLRGIPFSLLPRLMKLESAGYEFELEMLIAAHTAAVKVTEQPIRTIYEPGNKSSHFNPILDSLKIYYVLARYGFASLLTALLDNVVFYFAFRHFGQVITSQILGRAFAVAFNYGIVRGPVFYSKERHRLLLPKYLLLVATSGVLSYTGIQLLSNLFGIPIVPAKLIAEAILFFFNFAIQRSFIFKREPVPDTSSDVDKKREPIHPFSIVVAAVFALLLILEVYGIAAGRLFSQDIWWPEGVTRFLIYVKFVAVPAAVLLFFGPPIVWTIFAAIVLILTGLSTGPLALAATILFLASASALGSLLLGESSYRDSLEGQLCSVLLGTGVYIFLMTLLTRLPVNYPAFWGVVLAIPAAFDFRGIWRRLRGLFTDSEALRSRSVRASAVLLLFVLGAHWLIVLRPESGADALSMHLAVPMNIAEYHQMTIQPDRFVWAVMPMGADWCYSIVYLLGGEFAARLLNFSMLLLLAGLLFCTLRRWTSPAAGWLMVALFTATPLVQLVTGSLFVENLLAAMILGCLTAIWHLSDTGERRFLYLAMFLGGAAISVKFGALAFVGLALPVAFYEAWRSAASRGVKFWTSCLLGLAILLAAASPAYVIAYAKTGNPLFPFLNQKFASPYLDRSVDFREQRFRQPLKLSTLYDLTVHTRNFHESQNGSLGFQYVTLVPLGLLVFILLRRRRALEAALVGLGAAVIILRSEPNARYLYAGLPLILLPFGTLLGWAASRQKSLYRLLMGYVAVCTLLNVYFLPSSSHYFKDFSMRPFSLPWNRRHLQQSPPVRNVIAYYNRIRGNSAVLFTHDSFFAGAEGDVYENHWHQYAIRQKIRDARGIPELINLLQSWNIHYLVAHKPSYGESVDDPTLQELLASCTLPEYEFKETYLARLDPACRTKALTEPVYTVPLGAYDDQDPALVYQGHWTHDETLSEPYMHTLSYSNQPGSSVSISFNGWKLFYLYNRGPDRGMVDVTIDGKSEGYVDLYAREFEWHHPALFCCFSPGRHLAVIRIKGEKNPLSTGQRVDLDLFQVQ